MLEKKKKIQNPDFAVMRLMRLVVVLLCLPLHLLTGEKAQKHL